MSYLELGGKYGGGGNQSDNAAIYDSTCSLYYDCSRLKEVLDRLPCCVVDLRMIDETWQSVLYGCFRSLVIV